MAKTDVKRVLMDSSALLAWINGEPAAGRITGLLDMIDRGEAELVASVIVLAEVYKKSNAVSQRERELQDAKLAAIRAKLESRDVLLLDVTVPVARKATDYRGTHGMKLPDATHLATAVLNRCDWLVTLDRDFPQIDGLRVFRMKELLSSIELPWDTAVQQTFFAADDNVAWLTARPAER
ncbi:MULTISPECIES: type II toxin-antitoxin system VapC family toxin [Tessaracoccus]|uniref:Ribonuclease VapC n=1 Tax=Tessaracoccus bendigoensis DSM 12906 TaxID=1123357 RepID=A0A1M6BDX2_9ACTN|nr:MULTISPECIES: PIN domain-containing protein [Tessaracoccus]KYF76117.1 hypothetical protein BE11_34005 [Sorangium cellulosum]SHI46643.1 PIN domain-containing protein [Tessaracoccus bendigoensis DSM 12906]